MVSSRPDPEMRLHLFNEDPGLRDGALEDTYFNGA